MSANPALIEWPTDLDGVTSLLKHAVTTTAGNMNGREDKRDIILKVLAVASEHVLARFDAQVEENARTAEWRAQQEAERAATTYVKGYQA